MKRLLAAGAIGALFFLTTFLAGPAMAQDGRDEALRRQQDRLAGRQVSSYPQGQGYRGRLTSKDYEVERQMQQLDEMQRKEDVARLEDISIERAAISAARPKPWEKMVDEYYAEAERQAAVANDWLASEKQKSERAYESGMQRYEADRRASQARHQAEYDASMQLAEQMFQSSRAETARQAEETNQRVQEANRPRPIPIRPIPGPYFPDVDEVMGRR